MLILRIFFTLIFRMGEGEVGEERETNIDMRDIHQLVASNLCSDWARD